MLERRWAGVGGGGVLAWSWSLRSKGGTEAAPPTPPASRALQLPGLKGRLLALGQPDLVILSIENSSSAPGPQTPGQVTRRGELMWEDQPPPPNHRMTLLQTQKNAGHNNIVGNTDLG